MTYEIAVKVYLVNAKSHLNRATECTDDIDKCEAHLRWGAGQIIEARDELIREQGRRQVKKEVAK